MPLPIDRLISFALLTPFLIAAPATAGGYDEVGMASWYGKELAGRQTASGERFDHHGFSAAHRTLPMPSYVEVTALRTGRTVLVRINDRGPVSRSRIIDLSQAAAQQLGIVSHGRARVRVREVDPTDEERSALERGDQVERPDASSGELAALNARK